MANESETKTVTYFGKKTYRLNPRLAQKKPVQEKTPDYQDNESEDANFNSKAR